MKIISRYLLFANNFVVAVDIDKERGVQIFIGKNRTTVIMLLSRQKITLQIIIYEIAAAAAPKIIREGG